MLYGIGCVAAGLTIAFGLLMLTADNYLQEHGLGFVTVGVDSYLREHSSGFFRGCRPCGVDVLVYWLGDPLPPFRGLGR